MNRPAAAADDTDISLQECFELLREYTIGQAEGAELSSFTTLSNFVQFMYPSFKSLTEWPLINEAVNQDFTNHQFKDSFVKMLIGYGQRFFPHALYHLGISVVPMMERKMTGPPCSEHLLETMSSPDQTQTQVYSVRIASKMYIALTLWCHGSSLTILLQYGS